MTEIYYPRQAYMKAANAAVKPSSDFEDVLESMGAHGIGLKRSYLPTLKVVHLRNIFHNLLVRVQMPKGKTVVLQYPMQYHVGQLFDAAKRRGNKVIVMVHDINWLRGKDDYNFRRVLEGADVVIAHTPAMRSWLEERFCHPKVLVLGMFDYMQDSIPDSEDCGGGVRTVVFAGNLAKSTFLGKIDLDPSRNKLVLYGVGCPEELKTKPFVDYKGSCMPEEIPSRISTANFGLVWDGTTTATCDGEFGKYLQYNAPYKLSSYIAAGIPVVVWSKMGIADFVRTNNIGIAVDSLENLGAVIDSLSRADYDAMRRNVKALQRKVSAGGFAKSAMKEALR